METMKDCYLHSDAMLHNHHCCCCLCFLLESLVHSYWTSFFISAFFCYCIWVALNYSSTCTLVCLLSFFIATWVFGPMRDFTASWSDKNLSLYWIGKAIQHAFVISCWIYFGHQWVACGPGIGKKTSPFLIYVGNVHLWEIASR